MADAGTSKKTGCGGISTERRPIVTAANRKHRPKADFYSPLTGLVARYYKISERFIQINGVYHNVEGPSVDEIFCNIIFFEGAGAEMLLTNDTTDAANRCNIRLVTVQVKFGTQVAYGDSIDYLSFLG